MGRHVKAKKEARDYERGKRAVEKGEYREIPRLGSAAFKAGVRDMLEEAKSTNGTDKG